MEAWFIIIASLCIAALLKSVFTAANKKLPPGPLRLPFIGNLLWLYRRPSNIEDIIHDIRPRYGRLIALKISHKFHIFIGSHSLAHQALIQNSAVFSDRPTPPPSFTNRPKVSIIAASYGPTWRLLRRNITQEILHPARVSGYGPSRRWVLSRLIQRIRDTPQSSVMPMDHFKHAMFSLLVLMCFGDKLEEDQIKAIARVHQDVLHGFRKSNDKSLWHRLVMFVFGTRYNELHRLREALGKVLVPIVRARIQAKREGNVNKEDEVVAYVDTLLDIQLPEEKRKLGIEEIISLCGEFLNAGTDTTATTLQWAMANLVKFPQIQNKLYQEIISVVGPPPSCVREISQQVTEEDVQKMPYLKAVVLEALRRHPPVYFVFPHKVTQDVLLDGYTIPKDANVNFMVAEMGRDPEVWEDPMEFRPERFMGEAVDVTGSREIKMMPFGAGRRVCPGYGVALLHLEYFVANMIWYSEWRPVEGDEIDLSERTEFTVVMKNPLRARIIPRN